MFGAADALGASPDDKVLVHVAAASAPKVRVEGLIFVILYAGRVRLVRLVWVVVLRL